MRKISKWLFLFLGAICAPLFQQPGYAQFSLVTGHIYTTEADENEILESNPEGQQIGTLTIPGANQGIRGIAFGPDGMLYVVTVAPHGFNVVLINRDLEVKGTYAGTTYVRGNSSYGKIAVESNRISYVAGGDQLVKIDRYVAGTTAIAQANQIFDVDVLPTGNLLLLSAYGIDEITPYGQHVRRLLLGETLGDARGLEFDEINNKLFVTMLSADFSLMRFDFSNGNLERRASFYYGDDIALLPDGNLIVGSNQQPPRRFTSELQQLGGLLSTPRNFVVAMPEPMFIFQDGMELH